MTSPAENLKQELVALEVEIEEEEEADEESEDDSPPYPSNITSQICLKKMHPSEKMDKDVILRRIRHHKRMIKVKNAVDMLFKPRVSTNNTTNLKDSGEPSEGWVSDAFSAP